MDHASPEVVPALACHKQRIAPTLRDGHLVNLRSIGDLELSNGDFRSCSGMNVKAAAPLEPWRSPSSAKRGGSWWFCHLYMSIKTMYVLHVDSKVLL